MHWPKQYCIGVQAWPLRSLFQIKDIVGKYGIVVISRAGSDPEKFIYESDKLFPLRVCSVLLLLYQQAIHN